MPDAYIFPLDADEFAGYLRSPGQAGNRRGDVNPDWKIQFDRQGFMYALSEDQKDDEGKGGYFSTQMLDAVMCNQTLIEKGGNDTRLAKTSLIDPYDTDRFVGRLGKQGRLKAIARGEKDGEVKGDHVVEDGCSEEEGFVRPEGGVDPSVRANANHSKACIWREGEKKFVRAGNWKAYDIGAHTLGTKNGAKWRWSRIVLVHYGDRTSMTKAQYRQRLESRFVQAGWMKKWHMKPHHLHHLSKYILSPDWCGHVVAHHYCREMWALDKKGDPRPKCPSELASRGITVM